MGMEDALELFVTYLQPLLPDWLVRFLVRIVLGHALRQLWKLRWPQKELRLVSRVKQLASEEIAFDTAAANEQHYEVPTPFFLNSLGPRLKYSSCEWPGPDATLAEAETHTLAKYTELLGVADGQRVLDIGCGWGSFSLYAAERFPKTTFVCFSNSSTQIAHISGEASRRGLANLTALKMDINSLSAAALEERGGLPLYDRIFACESLEHSRNYQALFARIAKVLAPDGRFFVQILGHREYSYLMNAKSWMGRRFFTGGTIPSMTFFHHFTDDLCVERTEVVTGTEYSRTLDAWLQLMYAKREECEKILADGQSIASTRAIAVSGVAHVLPHVLGSLWLPRWPRVDGRLLRLQEKVMAGKGNEEALKLSVVLGKVSHPVCYFFGA